LNAAAPAFDSELYKSLNSSREEILRSLFSQIKEPLQLRTALDVGCGMGHFSAFLHSLGFYVTAVDGRAENAAEAKRRYPEISFVTANAEDLPLAQLPPSDLVLCFGLLYHLENPFRTIRHLHALTGKLLIIESMCAPGPDSSMELLDEYHAEDQGLNFVAFYPTESCLVKMLYRAGFPVVYGFVTPPDHMDFRATKRRKKARCMLAAAKGPLRVPSLFPISEPARQWDIWSAPTSPWRFRLARFATFLRRSRSETSPANQAARKT